MKMRKSIAAVGATFALLAVTACGGDSDSNASGEPDTGSEGDYVSDLTFGTGGTSGVYYPMGGEMATIWENNGEEVSSVNYVESGGSAENLGKIYQQEWQVGFSDNGTAQLAVAGELPDLEGEALDNIGWIGSLYPEAMHVVVREDSGIDSIADLKGKTIAVGDAGSGTRITSDKVLAAYGIEEGDYDAETTDFGSSTEMLADNQIDATMFVVGTPVGGLTQLAATTDVKLLPVETEQAEEVESQGAEEVYDIPTDVYDFLDEDVQTVAVFATIVASTNQVSEEAGYELTKNLFEHSDEITQGAAQFIDPQEALNGIGDVPLHPGAEKYYEEEGIDLP